MGDYIDILFFYFLLLLTGILCAGGCGRGESQVSSSPDKSANPNRCTLTDIGEAADFMQKRSIEDDILVVAHGLGNPQALVWREAKTNRTYYLARVMGTEKRLYFLREILEGETPGVPSRFKGHLLRWDHLPQQQARNMASGLKARYNVTFNPSDTYIILQGQKPKGCQ
jgi:hypothetical protein